MNTAVEGRYSRQELFAPIGVAGQARIRAATVGIVGCGALGSFQAEALARAGAGRIRIIDRDTVDASNLQRQWLFTERDAADELPKAVAAARRLADVNSEVEVEALVRDLTADNALEFAEGCTLLLDGTDNFETRFLINDVAVKLGVPWIYGAAVGSYGVVMAMDSSRGPCFRCVYPEGPEGSHPTCEVNGVLASTTASVAALQVANALRFLVGWSDFVCRLHRFDIWEGSWRIVDTGERDPGCETCGARNFRALDGHASAPVSLCGRNAVQLHVHSKRVDLTELAARLSAIGTVRVNDFALRVATAKYDVTIFPDGRAIVRGTNEIPVARSVYAQLVGA